MIFCGVVSLQTVCVPSVLSGRAVFDVDTSHIFPQGFLAALALVGDRADAGVPTAGARCEARLPFRSVVVTAVLEVASDPMLLEQKP